MQLNAKFSKKVKFFKKMPCTVISMSCKITFAVAARGVSSAG